MAARTARFVLVCVGLCSVGCEVVPKHEVPEAYPSSGPVGMRFGLTFQRNFLMHDALPYYDASSWYEEGFGGTVELPIDVNPFWGGFFGIGYEHFPGQEQGGREIDSVNVLPFYVGLVGRYPGWLQEEDWNKAEGSVWLSSPPVGLAPYARGAVGGAGLLNSPDMTTAATGATDRVFDYQILPFLDGALGLEYRNKWIGYWLEVGYRLYLLPDREEAAFGSDRMARMNGLRAQIGLTWYFW